jgi:hypothetical protein
MFLSGVLFVAIQSIAQTTNGNPKDPDVQINVNIERDMDGNIVRYDSSYSRTWSSNRQNISMDSIFNSMNQNFGLGMWNDFENLNDFFFQTPNFPNADFFFGDSLLMNDIYDFSGFEEMEKRMLQRMQDKRKLYAPYGSSPYQNDSIQFFSN